MITLKADHAIIKAEGGFQALLAFGREPCLASSPFASFRFEERRPRDPSRVGFRSTVFSRKRHSASQSIRGAVFVAAHSSGLYTRACALNRITAFFCSTYSAPVLNLIWSSRVGRLSRCVTCEPPECLPIVFESPLSNCLCGAPILHPVFSSSSSFLSFFNFVLARVFETCTCIRRFCRDFLRTD